METPLLLLEENLAVLGVAIHYRITHRLVLVDYQLQIALLLPKSLKFSVSCHCLLLSQFVDYRGPVLSVGAGFPDHVAREEAHLDLHLGLELGPGPAGLHTLSIGW